MSSSRVVIGALTGVQRLVLAACVCVLAGVLCAGLLLPVAGAIGSGARAGASAFQAIPDDLAINPLAERSRILDSTGRVIATFYDENRIAVPLSAMSTWMKQSIVAIEDSRYYQHGGIDIRGTIRALVNDLEGKAIQGGSTITQQYVKKTLQEQALQQGDNVAAKSATARSVIRKVRELKYAIALEDSKSKDFILQGYLNLVNFSGGTYGVEAASRHFFGIPAKSLTLPQAAMLAGDVQSPFAYDPVLHPKAALQRRNEVLQRMADLGYVTQASADATKLLPLGLHITKVANGCVGSTVPIFCDYVVSVIRTNPIFGATQAERYDLLYRGGLTIRTTLDPAMETAAQAAIDKHVYPTDKVASAIAMVEPGTGEIKAIAQSRPYGVGKNQTEIDYATNQANGGSLGFQSGSTMKAFVVAAAVQQGMSLATRINSPYHVDLSGKPYKTCRGVDTSPWVVENENTAEKGVFDIRTGAALSVNTFFAQLEERTGICDPATIAAKAGLTRADGKPLLQLKSFTLGTNEVSPLGMAEAYATFAARGMHCSSIAITSMVVDATKKSHPVPKAGCRQVISKDVADAVNLVLGGVIGGNIAGRTGAGEALGRPAAGKTGTTQGRVAIWFVGYTPNLAAAVWAGNPSPPKGGYSLANRTIGGKFFGYICGGCLPGPIWRDAMSVAVQALPPLDFTPPNPSVVRGVQVQVPDVTGLSVADAESKLQDAGFAWVVNTKQVASPTVPAGSVAYTKPGGGSSTSSGQLVVIYVSKGKAPAPPPTSPSATPTGSPTAVVPTLPAH